VGRETLLRMAGEKKSAAEVTTHLRGTRTLLKMHHDAVTLALQKVPGLINQEAGALKRLAALKRRDEVRKTSKESNDKAQKKRDREVAKNERKKLEARERALASSDSGSDGSGSRSNDMDFSEEEKAPLPRPPAQPRAARASAPTACQRTAPAPVEPERRRRRRNDQPAAAPSDPSPYTREQQACLNAWKALCQPTFQEWCYKEKHGIQMLENLIATRGSAAIPFTEPPAWWVAQQPVEEKKTPQPVLPPAAPISQEERSLRQQLEEHDIEDIRTPVRLPIPRSAPSQAAMMEAEATPSGSESKSDLSVTPAVGSMHVD